MGHVRTLVPLEHAQLLRLLAARFHGSPPYRAFLGVSCDDRLDANHPEAGELFVAIAGAHYDSHGSLSGLRGRGYLGAVGERPAPVDLDIPYYRVRDSRWAFAVLAQRSLGSPSRQLEVFGVTGTNGKSSTVRMLAVMLGDHRLGADRDGGVGWLGTVTNFIAGAEDPARMTTPEAGVIARSMARHVEAGGHRLVLEVSSHALDQQRVAGVAFAGAALTNVTRDHFDYHGCAERYLAAKLRLFECVREGGCCILPDDPGIHARVDTLPGRSYFVFSDRERGRVGRVDAFPEQVSLSPSGMRGRLNVFGEAIEFQSALIGRHNLLNLLTAALLARAHGVDRATISQAIQDIPPVPGRLQRVRGPQISARGLDVFVDYAHTPDALCALLTALREVTSGRLIVVFGCGGDRDAGKRPEMGAVAERLADVVFVTSDNPRSEDPLSIIEETLVGMMRPTRARLEVDRAQAIHTALEGMRAGDVLVVAGKGHEKVQYIGNDRLPFDDCHVIEKWAQQV